MEHSKFSASSSAKWLNCPASYSKEMLIENKTSTYAEEGTKAHSIAESLMRDPNNILSINCNEEMLNYVQSYIERNQELIRKYEDCVYLIEQKVKYENVAPDGFGTVDFLLFSRDVFYIRDFKYGKGVKVDTDNNSQLILYLIGALNLPEVKEYYGDDFDYNKLKFFISIDQPRINNVCVSELTYFEIQKHISDFSRRSKLCLEEEPKFVSGEKQCRFCRYKYKCESYLETTQKDNFKLFQEIDVQESISNLSDDKIMFLLDHKKEIESYLVKLEEYVLDNLRKGKPIANYAIGLGRSMRSWNNKAEEKLTSILGEDEVYVKKLKPVTYIEKLLGKKELENLDIVEFSQPKEILTKSK